MSEDLLHPSLDWFDTDEVFETPLVSFVTTLKTGPMWRALASWATILDPVLVADGFLAPAVRPPGASSALPDQVAIELSGHVGTRAVGVHSAALLPNQLKEGLPEMTEGRSPGELATKTATGGVSPHPTSVGTAVGSGRGSYTASEGCGSSQLSLPLVLTAEPSAEPLCHTPEAGVSTIPAARSQSDSGSRESSSVPTNQ